MRVQSDQTPSQDALMPRKPRLIDGHEIPSNLFEHQRKEPGRWRYKRPDGSFYHFEATLEEAIAAAEQLNAEFATGALVVPISQPKPGRLSLERHVEDFIEGRESRQPGLFRKASWLARKAYLRQLARDFAGTPVHRLTLLPIQDWWDGFSGHAQRARKAEFQRFFNYLMARRLCRGLEANPFSNSKDMPRVEMTDKPGRRRERLTVGGFWTIYRQAGEDGLDFLQVAMGISLLTTMRRGDICPLTFQEHVVGNHLRKQISKSHAQLSEKEFRADPSNLSWNLDEHLFLRQLVNRARELSMRHGRCPYLLSRRPQKCIQSPLRTHTHQVLPDFVTRAFTATRDKIPAFQQLPDGARPTFHEIRALSSWLLKKAGYQAAEVQVLMAHTDEKITRHYQAGHETEWTEIGIVVPDDVLGGKF